MKKLSIIICAALMSCISFAQSRVSPSFMCSYYGEPVGLPLTVVNSSEDAKGAIKMITDMVGVSANFEVKEANIPNAAAIIYNNKRYILYNPAFISRINNASGDKWAAIAILAHEIGHHLDGHTLSVSGSHPETELEADEFSGFVLRKMGATLDQAQSALKLLASANATGTHPAKASRLVSIDNGWTKSDAQLHGRSFTAKNIPVAAEPMENARLASGSSYTLNPEYVNFNVYFLADSDNKYFITKDNKLVTLRNNEIVLLGKMVRSDLEDFPFAVKLSNDMYFLISLTGNLLNKEGNKVGYLKG